MSEFLAELLGSLLEGLIPERARNVFIGLLMLLSGAVFVGFVCFMGYQIVSGQIPLVAGVPALMLLALSGLCFKLARKGLRSESRLDARARRSD